MVNYIGCSRLQLKHIEMLKWKAYVKIERCATSGIEDCLKTVLEMGAQLDNDGLSEGELNW